MFLEDVLEFLGDSTDQSVVNEENMINILFRLLEIGDSCSSDSKSESEQNVTHQLFRNADELIQNVWTASSEQAFRDFMTLVKDGVIPVDYQHSRNSITMLMAASVKGMKEWVTTLLERGANIGTRCKIPYQEKYLSAADWAMDYGHAEIFELLRARENAEVIMIYRMIPRFPSYFLMYALNMNMYL